MGAQVAQQEAADLVGASDNEREREHREQLGRGQFLGAEEGVHRRHVDQQRRESQPDGDAAEQVTASISCGSPSRTTRAWVGR